MLGAVSPCLLIHLALKMNPPAFLGYPLDGITVLFELLHSLETDLEEDSAR